MRIVRSFGVSAAALVVQATVAGCDGESTMRADDDAAPTASEGSWQRIHGPERRALGFQDLVPVRVGDKVVVVAGVDHDQTTVKGIVFDAGSRGWSPTTPSRVWWRNGQSAVAAGPRVIIWGGCCGPAGRGSRAPGAIYDVPRDRWHPLKRGPIGNRYFHTAVWTGKEMIVWGGFSGSVAGIGRPQELRADGAAYDPRSDTWRLIAPAPLSPRKDHVAVWTGEEMIVWGGSRPISPPRQEAERLLFDGAAYDPERDEWRRLATTRLLGAPGAILGAGDEPDLAAAWTGDEMMIWSRYGGASYDPASDRWERIAGPPPEIRVMHPNATAVWTGEEMIVWGGTGNTGTDFVTEGAAYDPRAKVWTGLPEAPIAGRDRHAAIWTGRGMLVWGGCCRGSRYYADGAIYVRD